MTASSSRGSQPGKRLWLLAIALICCFTVYLIIAPLLYRKAMTSWVFVLVAAVADLAALATLALMWVLRRQQAAALDSGARLKEQAERRLREQAGQQNAELQQRDQQMRRQSADLHDRLAASAQVTRQALEHFVTVRLPMALDGSAVPSGQKEGLDENVAGLLERAITLAAGAADKQESMRAAVIALSRRVQTSAHRIQEEATVMADRHPGDPDVLEVSMRVDHAAAQQARHAQSMAVLCGEWPGQQWLEPLPLVDVVRAAAGRIIAYRRIEVAGDPDIAVTAPVVEPLIHLVAELLANATQSAPPTTMVPVTIRSVQRGAVIEIHDCGIGLDEHRLSQAREVASGQRLIGLDGLGEYPQTGLAVVGQYVRRHGFRVDVSESVYGGVRVVVGVPAEVVEVVEPAEAMAAAPSATIPAAPAAPPVTWPAGNGATAAPADTGDALQETARDDGLPRRRSRRHASADAPVPAVPAAPKRRAPGWGHSSGPTRPPAPVTRRPRPPMYAMYRTAGARSRSEDDRRPELDAR
jgi:signal transduction histidine kinase